MSFDIYQKKARKSAFYPNKGKKESLLYLTLGLVGEAGEVAEHLKHILRDNEGKITKENKLLLIKELGDVLWYISNFGSELNIDLKDIARINLEKINSRKARDVLKGRGDNR